MGVTMMQFASDNMGINSCIVARFHVSTAIIYSIFVFVNYLFMHNNSTQR